MKVLTILLICAVSGVLLVALIFSAGMFVSDQIVPGDGGATARRHDDAKRDLGILPGSPLDHDPQWKQKLAQAVSGNEYAEQCRERSDLVKRFYELGAENVWVHFETKPPHVLVQLPVDPASRQAIVDRVAEECACGNIVDHQHLFADDGLVVVRVILEK